MRLQKPKNILVMAGKPMLRFGITWVNIKSRRANQIHIRSKPIMPSYVITWLVWQDHHDVFRVVPMPWLVPFAYLSIVSIADSYTNVNIQLIQFTWLTSWAHNIHHFEFNLSQSYDWLCVVKPSGSRGSLVLRTISISFSTNAFFWRSWSEPNWVSLLLGSSKSSGERYARWWVFVSSILLWRGEFCPIYRIRGSGV